MPVAILPTEMEMDYDQHQFFDFRKKYLPTRQVTYHCPPRFKNEIIEKIQIQAEQLFSVFGMRDFARFDGFLMPDGNIWFSDFNPISGMEQNSFLFQQASRIGFSHQDLLRYIVNNAFVRRGIHTLMFSGTPTSLNIGVENIRKPVAVLFGGETAEKQVSLMSGTNVWLKLRGSGIYEPHPFLLAKNKQVWELPYSYILNHTVEEIIENAENAKKDIERLFFLIEKVKIKLCLRKNDATEDLFIPKKYSLEKVLKKYPFIFLALHGGIGENGSMQKILENKKIKFNGSNSVVSKLCMDKWETNEIIAELNIKEISVAKHVLFKIKDTPKVIDDDLLEAHWRMLIERLGTKTIIAKPRGDGCSAGVVRLFNKKDLATYISLIKDKITTAAPRTFTNQTNTIDMPEGEVQDMIFESFIETDKLKAHKGKIKYNHKSGYVEMTVGVVEEKFSESGEGKIKSLSPSVTIAEDTILSVEEKFQGGTGVNITPPPGEIISAKNIEKVKILIEAVAKKIGIRGYARIDIFVQVKTGNIVVIEINTLPGLTPSTVIYHQALAEKHPMFPKEFLELLIKNKGY
jgi:D-alanine-D-alanine ligase-like ATP-grasp enzyme